MKKIVLLIMSIALSAVLSGCQSSSDKEAEAKYMQSITGMMTYRERMALPKDALVTVTLQDVSKAGAKADILATHSFKTDGMQVPINFELKYDEREIQSNHRYSVRATIELDGKLRFTTDTNYAVITDEAQTKNVNLGLIGVRGR